MPNITFKPTLLCGAIALAGFSANFAFAGSTAVGTTPVFVPPIVSQPPAPTLIGPPGVTPANTAAIVNSLDLATTFCSGMGGAYVIDCMAERLEVVSREYAGLEGYESATRSLSAASEQLNQIARDNRSSTQQRARFRSEGPDATRTSRPLTPVDEAKLNGAVNEAIAVLDSTETLLLRSADNSTERLAQFQQIADAVGSNKVLLRSI